MTDIHTTWVETPAVMGRSQPHVQEALEHLRQALPFPLRGIDSDNGSEFINAHLQVYCRAHQMQFTRGRPYQKDDNAHTEQRQLCRNTNSFQAIGVDGRSRADVLLLDERDHRRLFAVRDHRHPNPTRDTASVFNRHHDNGRLAPFELATAPQTGLRPADPGVVTLTNTP